jgi:uncharacterized protein YjeT (DUF2065 family)
MNDKILLSVLAYLVLQGTLLLVLPKWWKAAACPALLVLPIMFAAGDSWRPRTHAV